jgi:hypothetical protein
MSELWDSLARDASSQRAVALCDALDNALTAQGALPTVSDARDGLVVGLPSSETLAGRGLNVVENLGRLVEGWRGRAPDPPGPPQVPVLGVGIARHELTGENRPLLLLAGGSPEIRDLRTTTDPTTGRPSIDLVRDGLEHHLHGANPDIDEFDVFAVPAPQLHGPGEVVHATTQGTLGARVTVVAGTDGILTAGHVAHAGVATDAQGGCIGTVTFSEDPSRAAAGSDCVDVAVIELDPNYIDDEGLPHAAHPAPPVRPGDRITAYGNVTGRMTQEVWLVLKSGRGPSGGGDWADLLMVKPGFSTQGDSGGPVFVEGTDELVGHIVAGGRDVYSWVQDITVQLSAIGARLR